MIGSNIYFNPKEITKRKKQKLIASDSTKEIKWNHNTYSIQKERTKNRCAKQKARYKNIDLNITLLCH